MNEDFAKLNNLESEGNHITVRFISEKLNMEISDSIELLEDWKRSKVKICEGCE